MIEMGATMIVMCVKLNIDLLYMFLLVFFLLSFSHQLWVSVLIYS